VTQAAGLWLLYWNCVSMATVRQEIKGTVVRTSSPLHLRGLEISHWNCFWNMARAPPYYFTFHCSLNTYL